MYKPTIHDGSVSYSVMLPDPPEGEGKHYKPPNPLIRDVLRRMHIERIGKPDESSQMAQDAVNRRLKKSMNKIRM